MAEAVAVVGLVAAIAQFIEYASRLSTRLDEVAGNSGSFASLKARLMAVTAVVKRIRKQAELGRLSAFDGEPLVHLITNTGEDVQALLVLLEQALPGAKDKAMARYVKAARSLSKDKEIQRITSRLHESIQVISLFQTTALVDLGHRSHGTGAVDGQPLLSRTESPSSIPDQSPPLDCSGPDVPAAATPTSGIVTTTSDSEEDNDSPGFGNTDRVQTGTDTPWSTISMDVKRQTSPPSLVRREDGCTPLCSCVCHRSFQLASPNLLRSLIGQVSVVYGGQPILALPCTERQCRRRGQTAASMIYRLPPWLLPLALHTTLTSTALNTRINLNTLRVLADSAEVLSVLSHGDLPKLRELIITNQASIHDVSGSNWTLLHTAYTLGHMHMVSFLLQQGADPTIAADNGSNVIERAWFFAQKSAKSPGDYVLSDNDVLKMIDLDDFMSQQQYTILHKIVLGLCKLPLEEVLASSTREIDQQDVRGNTPLWWAAAQGNLPSIRTLVDHHADQNIGGGLNQLPLHVARDAATVRMLCELGGRIEATDTLGRTPLHCFCYRQVGSNAATIRAALTCGAPVNARAQGGQTPLHYAVMFGNTDLVQPLLDAGADMCAVMRAELTPLAAAIRYDQTAAARVLVANKSPITSQIIRQFRTLEIAATWAGVRCLDVLADALEDGEAATEMSLPEAQLLWKAYEARALRWDELDEAFGKLLGALHVDVEALFSHYHGARKPSGSFEAECSGCLPIPGAFCG